MIVLPIFYRLISSRCMNQREIDARERKAIECREAARQVEVANIMAGKKFTKTYTFDKVRNNR
jgi:hypothetical protein